MNVLPVITRELQAESRHSSNHWLRVTGILISACIFLGFIINPRSGQLNGGKIFIAVHTTVYVMIWLLIPAMTADCIARERREGTLGLLFLTPLRAHEIVLGKSIVHMLRGMTLFAVTWPVFCIPFLMGGVTWLDIYTAFTFQFSAVLLALSAGVLASSFGKNWTRTFLLAEAFTILLAVIYAVFLAGWLERWTSSRLSSSFLRVLEGGVFLTTVHGKRCWSSQLSAQSIAALTSNWSLLLLISFLFTILLFFAAIFISGTRIKSNWQEEPLSKRQVWWLRTFCTPQFWNSVFRKNMKRVLENNPIAWLQQYSWSARLSKWGWCLAIVVAECVLVGAPNAYYNFSETQPFLGIAICIGLAFSAAASFRRERENGALELLLVTPLREAQIVFGRLFGVWKQMLPAGLILIVAISAGSFMQSQVPWTAHVLLLSTVVVTPFIGLYLSLRMKQFLFAWLATVFLAMFLPWIGTVVPAWILEKAGMSFLVRSAAMTWWFLFLQWSIAVFCIGRLFRNLKQRTFVIAAG